MTVTYKSNQARKKNRLRPVYSGEIQNYQARIDLPDGTVLSSGDILLGPPVGENVAVLEVSALTIGNCGSLAGSMGYFQILDPSGNAVVVERKGPRGDSSTKYTSPSSAPTAYHAAEALAGYVVNVLATPAKTTGPVYIGISVTTGATMTGDVEMFIGAKVMGEVPTAEVVGSAAPSGNVNDYLLNS